MVVGVDAGDGGGVKTCEEGRGGGWTSGEPFVMFIVCFAELDSVVVLWKQTQVVKENSKIAEQSTENEIS